jgi:hypothetical protein
MVALSLFYQYMENFYFRPFPAKIRFPSSLHKCVSSSGVSAPNVWESVHKPSHAWWSYSPIHNFHSPYY